MLCINSISNDPYFNLATEEFLLKESDEEFFLTYINEPSIVVGKHQNTYAEINLEFVRSQNIKVARRLTGGGTVFHDHGNLNFSFITNGEEERMVDFKKHTQPILDFLEGLSVRAEFGGKNDLLLDGFKVSGNAEHVFRNRVLHHGTLLVNSDLSRLSEALKVNPSKYRDKAVRSIRSRVSNISRVLHEKISTVQLAKQLTDYIIKEKAGSEYFLSAEETTRILSLAEKKFSTWEWNFGYSSRYTFSRTITGKGKTGTVTMEVEKGIIKAASVTGDLFDEKCAGAICDALTGIQHRYEKLLQALKGLPVSGCFGSAGTGSFVKELF